MWQMNLFHWPSLAPFTLRYILSLQLETVCSKNNGNHYFWYAVWEETKNNGRNFPSSLEETNESLTMVFMYSLLSYAVNF
jgi:hypothetical protein